MTSGSTRSPPNILSGFRGLGAQLVRQWDDVIGENLYRYYNWRQDTTSDLQLFVVLNVIIILLGAAVRRKITEVSTTTSFLPSEAPTETLHPGWWDDLYRVLIVVLGQDLPAPDDGFPSQLFGVATAVLGLASFALVLALIEQVVLEVLEGNVRRGSRVYERNHYCVLAWGESARDLAQVTRVLVELCAAARPKGGTTIAVLVAHREKLELEAMYREAVGPEQRFGSQLVFRQGSPLDPGALRMVAAPQARSVIIMGDYSRPVEESDAQVLRAAVLLDELAAAEGTVSPSKHQNNDLHRVNYEFHPLVVVDVQGPNTPDLLHYACSDRVIPVHTTLINAQRYARLLEHPVVATMSHALFDHTSQAHLEMGMYPELVDMEFGELPARFPNAIVVGIVDRATGETLLNPPPNAQLSPGKGLVMLQAATEAASKGATLPLREAMPGYDRGKNWDPMLYVLRTQDESPLGKITGGQVPVARNAYARDFNPGVQKVGGKPLSGPDPGTEDPRPRAPPALGPSVGVHVLSAYESGRKAGWSFEKYLSPLRAAPALPTAYQPNSAFVPGSELLICGWAGHTFMTELLRELDRGLHALPQGANVVILNDHSWKEIGPKCKAHEVKNIHIRHVQCDPRHRHVLANALDVAALRAAIILHDTKWAPTTQGYRSESSAYFLSEADMMRMDASVLAVQLNIRYLLEMGGLPDINLIAEKLTYVGMTRFENLTALPLGSVVNSASYAAKSLAQVAVQPATLKARAQLGRQCDVRVQDAGDMVNVNEELSFLQLQARCASVQQVLLGYYRLPSELGQPVQIVVNPQGKEERTIPMVWNAGDARCKLITLAPRRMRPSHLSSDDPPGAVHPAGNGASPARSA